MGISVEIKISPKGSPMKDIVTKLFGILLYICVCISIILGLFYFIGYLPISLFVIGIILLLSLYFADMSLWHNYYGQVKDKSHKYLIGLVCLAVISTFVYNKIQQSKHHFDINSQYCDKEFDFKGYIYAFPDDTKSKNYRLVADFSKVEDYDTDTEDREHYYHYITLNRIYFNNGGYIDFENCNEVNKDGELFSCTAINDDRDWSFRFYGEQIKDKK